MTNSVFNFIRVDSFLDDINREDCFDTKDMDGVTPNYKFILASSCPDDINECIDEDGTLNDSVTIVDTIGIDDGYCSMLWSSGINGERTMSVSDSVVNYSLGDTVVQVQACFLCNVADGTGYVIAYAINNKAIEMTGDLIMPVDGVIWTFRYGD